MHSVGDWATNSFVSPNAKASVMNRCTGRRVLLATTFATLAGIAVVAVAQPATGPGRGPGGGPGYGMMGGGGMMGGSWNTASYLDSLKARLDITASQEAAWKEYADTVSGVGEQMQGLHKTMFEAMGTASWQERRDSMDQMFQARQQAFDTVHDAANKLMESLDPAQRTKAQGSLPGLAYRRGMMGQR
jgi:hypothetical protein